MSLQFSSSSKKPKTQGLPQLGNGLFLVFVSISHVREEVL